MSHRPRPLSHDVVETFVARVKAERAAAGQAATIQTAGVYAALRSAVRGADLVGVAA